MSTVSELALAARRWPPPPKDNAARGPKTAAASKNSVQPHDRSVVRHPAIRRLPAYWPHLLMLRERGQVPTGVVIVSAGLWLQDQVPPGDLLAIPVAAIWCLELGAFLRRSQP
jgi:hypothetical protein